VTDKKETREQKGFEAIRERNGKMAGKEKEKDREITFRIEEHIGVIATSATGWKKELNLVAWNGSPAKYDIREWDENHAHMSRGITMNKDEVKALSELLNSLELE
jgi:hypothetical protein